MRKLRTCLAFGTASVLASLSSLAGPLAPTKPSQLVTARSFNTQCPFNPNGPANTAYLTDRMTPAGGVEGPLVFPPKSVLVVTQARLSFCCPVPGTIVPVELVTFDSAGTKGVLASATPAAGSTGAGVETLLFPTGVVVRPETPLCAIGASHSTGADITGYFTKDR